MESGLSRRTESISVRHKNAAGNNRARLFLGIHDFSRDRRPVSDFGLGDHKVLRRVRCRAVWQRDCQVHRAGSVGVHIVSARKADTHDDPCPTRTRLIDDC